MYLTAIVVCSVIATPRGAVVLQAGREADSSFTARPGDGVIGSWATNASAVAIGPNFALTTRHQGGGVGTAVSFGGSSYTVTEVFDCFEGSNEVDLRLVRIMDSTGAPANLGEYVSLYTASDEAGPGGSGGEHDAALADGDSGGGESRPAPPLHVPEPTVVMLLAFGGVGVLLKKR